MALMLYDNESHAVASAIMAHDFKYVDLHWFSYNIENYVDPLNQLLSICENPLVISIFNSAVSVKDVPMLITNY